MTLGNAAPSAPGGDSNVDLQRGQNQLKRSLATRHLNMIAIGGAIGTGLFVASGLTISDAGPGGALVAYIVMGAMVFFLMQSLGEMATYMPISGSFGTYSGKFVSPSFGFAISWNYWFSWAITVAVELVASALIMKYWLPDVPSLVWSVGFLLLLFGLNYLSARAFGEGEFWFASIKVIAIIFFLILGVLMIFGIMGGPAPGTRNWTIGDAPFAGGIMAMIGMFMVAGFSFQGTELVGIAAGESDNPEKNVPKAIRTVFWRILLFYVGAITVIGFLLPYNDPKLLGGGDITPDSIAVSPFTLVFERGGIAFAAALMNAVILTSILSAGNSGLYASTRMLYALAIEGKAPAVFKQVNTCGVPVPALLLTTAVGALCFITSLVGDSVAYKWLLNISALTGFIAWLGIAWSHYNFRRAYMKQGKRLEDLPFRASFYPAGPIIALVLCIIVILGQGWSLIFSDKEASPIDFMAAYIGVPAFLLVWLGHKLITKSQPVPLDRVDLSRAGLLEADRARN